MTTVAGDSDSDDDHELPEEEPEFIVHIVDDHRPPAPPLQMHRPPVLPYRLPPVAQQLGGGGGDDDEGPRGCTYFFFIKVIFCALIVSMGASTLCVARTLPEEYRTGGDRGFITVAPIVILVLAFVWIVISLIVDRERW